MEPQLPPVGREPSESVWNVANVVYALHTFAIVVGIAGTATVIGSFVGSIPSILAVVLNYAKRGDARGTWIESHYSWQIRTFWYTVLWLLVAGICFVSVVGIPLFFVILACLTAWVVYRIGRGWLRLRDRRPMYA